MLVFLHSGFALLSLEYLSIEVSVYHEVSEQTERIFLCLGDSCPKELKFGARKYFVCVFGRKRWENKPITKPMSSNTGETVSWEEFRSEQWHYTCCVGDVYSLVLIRFFFTEMFFSYGRLCSNLNRDWALCKRDHHSNTHSVQNVRRACVYPRTCPPQALPASQYLVHKSEI